MITIHGHAREAFYAYHDQVAGELRITLQEDGSRVSLFFPVSRDGLKRLEHLRRVVDCMVGEFTEELDEAQGHPTTTQDDPGAT